MTPQLARIDARNVQQGAHRVCYAGTVLRTRVSNLFPSRAPIQAGCELFGVADTAADIEVISMMLETLATSRITDIHLDLSHVGIYQHILNKSGLAEQTAHFLKSALRRKCVPEIQQVATEIKDSLIRDYLLALPGFAGNSTILDDALLVFDREPEIVNALLTLAQVVEVISARYPAINIFIDLCEMRGFNYHTGLLFAAYTAGLGQAIAQGGRYDGVGGEFGNARPATGFSADLKVLLRMGDFQHKQQTMAILAPALDDPGLWCFISKLRQTEKVLRCMPGEETLDWRAQCDRKIVKNELGEWSVVAL
jgi:ATP phosphoribosyltransferase regulatory subunit